jgi:hypothetical protein
MLDLLLGESVMRRVGKKGIAYDGCQYAHLDLIEYTGHNVFIMAPNDMGYVLVYNEKMEFVCIAEDLEHMGKDRHKVRAGRKKSLALLRSLDKIVKEASLIKDTSIMDRIEAVSDIVGGDTIAVMKHTEAVDRLLQSSPAIAAKDKAELTTSKRYDFTNKDEDGKPQKVLPSGRPQFETMHDRFVWVLEHNDWTDKDRALQQKYPEAYEGAYKEYERKIG